MDSVDIQNFEEDIEEIQASFVRAANHEGSEDTVSYLIQELGRKLGNRNYDCDGPNSHRLNPSSLKEVETYLGPIAGDKHNPKLLIPNPLDENDPIEIPIIDPTEQYSA